jgi:hypothetical protein
LNRHNSRADPTEPKIKIYCLYSHDIEKSKTKFLSKNHITCVKKPIQGYSLSKMLRKVKTAEAEMVHLSLRNLSQE